MKMMHKALVLAAMTFAVSSAYAQNGTKSDTMSVTATVTPNCLDVTADDITFGDIAQGEPGDGVANVTANCGQDTAYIIAVEGGNNAVDGLRNLSNGSHLLPYSLKVNGADVGTDNLTAIAYTPTTGANGVVLEGVGAGNGADDVFVIDAAVSASDSLDAPAGDYTDSVQVVVAF